MCALALLDDDDRRLADRDRARPEQQPGAGALGSLDQLAAAEEVGSERLRIGDAKARAGLLEDLAAERGPLVDEADREAGRGRLGSRREPRGSAADDEDVVGLCRHRVASSLRGPATLAAGPRAVVQRQAGIGGSGAPMVAL